jgi:hypothetical protein
VYTCRECENVINQGSEICPYCGADLTLPAGADSGLAAKKPSLRAAIVRWSALLLVLIGAIWSFLWFVMPEPGRDRVARAEAGAVDALREIRAALVDYAGAQGGAYPASLEVLGDRVRLPAQIAQREGYQMLYTPGPAGPDGAVHNFVLLARPGNYSYRNFYLDETGVLRATQENRPASTQDPPISGR